MVAAQLVRALRQPCKLCGLAEEHEALLDQDTDVRLVDVRDLVETIVDRIEAQLPHRDRRPPPTDETREAVLALAREGATDPEIARQLRMSEGTVRRTRRAAGISGNTRALPDWETPIRACHADGLTTAEIAESTGYTIRTVQQRLSQLGLRANRATRRDNS